MMKEIKPIIIKNKYIGGKNVLICLPLVGKSKSELIEEAQDILAINPDLVEWRGDYFEDVENIKKVVETLKEIHNILKDYPIIYTCRIAEEGGYREIPLSKRMDLMKAVIDTKLVDIIDIELINNMEVLQEIIKTAHKNNMKVIISNHDFDKTPSKEMIIERLIKGQEYGGDIVKIALMPRNKEDVLTLLKAALEAREKHLDIPIIAISMSEIGVISRIIGGVFGSSITFASGKTTSAPGQIPIGKLRRAIDIIEKST